MPKKRVEDMTALEFAKELKDGAREIAKQDKDPKSVFYNPKQAKIIEWYYRQFLKLIKKMEAEK